MLKTQVIRDWRGHVYHVGLSPTELTGRPRTWMLWLPWAAMLAISPLQYGYGAAVPHLMAGRGWTLAQALWPMAVWAICQAAVALPTARLLDRGGTWGASIRPTPHAAAEPGLRPPPPGAGDPPATVAARAGGPGVRPALLVAAVLVVTGLLTVAVAEDPALLLIGYGVLGGVGAGIVYAVCGVVVSAWYPERPAAHVGLVTGAFAYGSVPLAIAAPYATGPAFLACAALAAVAVTAAAALVRTPPPAWWPPHLDPRRWAVANPAFRVNPRAVREFSLGQAVRTEALPILAGVLVAAAAVSLFNVVWIAVLAVGLGPAAWAAVVLALAANGAGRAAAMRVSERVGRRRALALTLTLLGVGQLLLSSTTAAATAPALIAAALVAGLGGGAFYPLIASLVRDYFGETRTTRIHATVYTAKALAAPLAVALTLAAASPFGHSRVLLLTAALTLSSAILTTRLRQPGRPTTIPRNC